MQEQKQIAEEEALPSYSGVYRARIALITFVLTLLGFLIVMRMSFMGSTFFGGIGATIAWMYGAEMVEPLTVALEEGKKLKARKEHPVKQLPGHEPKEEAEKLIEKPATTKRFDDEDGDDLIVYSKEKKTAVLDQFGGTVTPGLFSQVLQGFSPSLTRIYLGVLVESGQLVSVEAPKLCHTAIAGSTGEGKSSILRLLMLQLCYINASMLLLNPHYTSYDLEAKEDWTPFEPYLVQHPMECRQYEAIAYYLEQVATDILPKRLEKYAHSQPVGKPYFLVIDELPAIIDHVPQAARYLATILREGRKVGIFLITASQDFLVKTISPEGGGAVRDCYRTAFYVGGDATTARKLLDISSNQIQEHLLGKGTVMLRSSSCKQASLARVPYVDNQALYDLLGPSTYVPGEAGADDEDELILEHLSPSSLDTSVLAPSFMVKAESVPATKVLSQSLVPGRVMPKLTPELQMVLDVYKPGMSHRNIEHAIKSTYGKKVSHVTAGKHLQRLKDLHIIDVDGNLLVNR